MAIHDVVQRACDSNDLRELSALKVSKSMLLSIDAAGNIPIITAAAAGNIQVIRLLDALSDQILGYDAYKIFGARNIQGYNALGIAAKNHHIPAVIALYELGAYDTFTANQFDWEIYAEMHIKPNEDSKNIAENLKFDSIKRLGEIYAKDLYEEVSKISSNPQKIREYIKLVGDVNAIVYDEHTALFHAVRNKNEAAVGILINAGATVMPEMLAVALDSRNDVIISLLGQNIPLGAIPIEWGVLLDGLLDFSVRRNDVKVLERLLPHMSITKLQQAFLYAAEIGSTAILMLLLNSGVDIDCRENNNRARTAAMLAAKKGNADILAVLIQRGADLQLRSERGFIKGLNALEYAKIYRRKNCVKMLLETFTLRKYGDTPLMHIAACGTITELNKILPNTEQQGHVPDLRTLKTAIHAAKEARQPRIVVQKLKKYLHDHYARFSFFRHTG